MTTERKILAALFLVAMAIRLTWTVRQPSSMQALKALPDQVEYLSLGRNLLQHHELFFYDPRFEQVVYAYRTPGYPIFIALCGGSPVAVRVVQSVIDASDVLAVYLLAEWFVPSIYALLAATFIAFDPFLVFFGGLILSETLCTAMILWSLVLCMLVRRRYSYFGPVVAALSVLVRPSGLFLPMLIPLAAGLKHKAARLGAVVGLASLIVFLGLWAWRNQAVLGDWIWTTTNAGITQYDGFNSGATGASDQRFVQKMPYLQQIGEVARNSYLHSLADAYMQTHPGRVFTLALAKLERTFSPIPLSEQFDRPMYLAIAVAYSVPTFLLALVALIRWRGGWRSKLLLLSVPIYFAFVHAFSIGSLRYRMPAEPFLAILAAAGFESLAENKAMDVNLEKSETEN
ncbi:MAG TPA: hypothetical protein VG722_12145 [Tepidisphaeraceae bacterium]|nr:hypothetical protein [Tepidisphaeraceae bacterium]